MCWVSILRRTFFRPARFIIFKSLSFDIALAAGAFLAFAGRAHLNFVESAVAAVVVIFAHVDVAGNAEINVFHNTSKTYAHIARYSNIILRQSHAHYARGY